MRIRYKVKLKDFDKFKKLSKEKTQRVLMKSMFKMEELAISKAPVDTGYLKQNISLFPQLLSKKYVLISKAGYSEDLEFGNNPKYVKFGVLLDWVKRKGIRLNDENAAAFATYVQKKIKKEGVNPQPFLRPSLYEVKEKWFPQYAKEESQN